MSGTVTFLLTDVQHSTQLWERDAAEMRLCLERHDEIVALCVANCHGKLIKERGEGDSQFAVFDRAADAAKAAIEIQKAIFSEPWSTIKPIRIRIAVHTGEAESRDGDLYGHAVNKTARLRSVAHAGQILISLATRELIYHQLPQDAWLEDLGEHRLKDMLRPERVFQLCHKDLPASFPQLNSLDAKKNNLPLLLTSFIGREEEIAELNQKLQEVRLITLCGPGGCGKTRLALQVAAENIENFEDGVWVIDLSSVEDENAVNRAVATTLGVELSPGRDLAQDILNHFANGQMLIVLDNCEHLGRSPAKFCDLVLKNSSRNRILATSRKSLGPAAERVHHVRPLTWPGKKGGFEQISEAESVILLCERAKAKSQAFQLTKGNAPAIAELCAALEGIPLAIELAASRLKILSPEQLCARLSKSLDLLKSASEETDPRHRTLRATIDWSYQQLRQVEQHVLQRLSIPPAGCTLELAERLSAEIIGDEDILDVLESLLDNSLIRAETGDAVRYRILETIRQYCVEYLDEGANESAHRCLYNWALEFATLGKEHLRGSDQEAWQQKFEKEYENILAALVWCSKQGGNENLLLDFAGEMDRFWVQKGMVAEGGDWLQKALDHSGGDPQRRAAVLKSAGAVAWLRNDVENARILLQQSVDLFQELADEVGRGGALSNLGSFLAEHGHVQEARQRFSEALEIVERLNEKSLAAILHQNLGALEMDVGNLEAAEAHLNAALPNIPNKFVHATALNNLGMIRRKQKDYRKAIEYINKGLSIAKSIGLASAVADLVFTLASIAYEEERYEISARLAACAANIWKTDPTLLRGTRAQDMERLQANLRESIDIAKVEEASNLSSLTDVAQIADYALAGAELLLIPFEHLRENS